MLVPPKTNELLLQWLGLVKTLKHSSLSKESRLEDWGSGRTRDWRQLPGRWTPDRFLQVPCSGDKLEVMNPNMSQPSVQTSCQARRTAAIGWFAQSNEEGDQRESLGVLEGKAFICHRDMAQSVNLGSANTDSCCARKMSLVHIVSGPAAGSLPGLSLWTLLLILSLLSAPSGEVVEKGGEISVYRRARRKIVRTKKMKIAVPSGDVIITPLNCYTGYSTTCQLIFTPVFSYFRWSDHFFFFKSL